MHMRIMHAGAPRAYPLFGLNAASKRGVLFLTARDNPVAAQVAIMPFSPPGVVEADGTIAQVPEPSGYPLICTYLTPGSGVCVDGVDGSQVAYLYVGQTGEHTVMFDVSFSVTVTAVEVR